MVTKKAVPPSLNPTYLPRDVNQVQIGQAYSSSLMIKILFIKLPPWHEISLADTARRATGFSFFLSVAHPGNAQACPTTEL